MNIKEVCCCDKTPRSSQDLNVLPHMKSEYCLDHNQFEDSVRRDDII